MRIDVKDIVFAYKEKRILDGVSFSLESGKSYALMGKNGSGKTTLFKLMLGILEAKSGEILADGRRLTSPDGRVFSYIPQNTNTLSGYECIDVALMALASTLPVLSAPDKTSECNAMKLFEKLGIAKLGYERIENVSGGERALVLFARAILQNASFLMLDEPTANLDYENQISIHEKLDELKREDKGILFSTHNPSEALEFADEILILDDRKLIFSGGREEAYEEKVFERLYEGKIKVMGLNDGGKNRYVCLRA